MCRQWRGKRTAGSGSGGRSARRRTVGDHKRLHRAGFVEVHREFRGGVGGQINRRERAGPQAPVLHRVLRPVASEVSHSEVEMRARAASAVKVRTDLAVTQLGRSSRRRGVVAVEAAAAAATLAWVPDVIGAVDLSATRVGAQVVDNLSTCGREIRGLSRGEEGRCGAMRSYELLSAERTSGALAKSKAVARGLSPFRHPPLVEACTWLSRRADAGDDVNLAVAKAASLVAVAVARSRRDIGSIATQLGRLWGLDGSVSSPVGSVGAAGRRLWSTNIGERPI